MTDEQFQAVVRGLDAILEKMEQTRTEVHKFFNAIAFGLVIYFIAQWWSGHWKWPW